MTQTIEQLQARVRELEADLVAARQIIDEENKDHIEQLATAEQRVAEACADLYIDDLNNGAPFIANRMREGEYRKYMKGN